MSKNETQRFSCSYEIKVSYRCAYLYPVPPAFHWMTDWICCSLPRSSGEIVCLCFDAQVIPKSRYKSPVCLMYFYRTKRNNVDPRLKRETAKENKKGRKRRVLIFSKTENRTKVKLSYQPTSDAGSSVLSATWQDLWTICGGSPRENKLDSSPIPSRLRH